ncbi:MAG: hypothetical protein WD733_09020 [Bryobacterales bacterium]
MFIPRIALALLLLAPAFAIDKTPLKDALVTHEWGTFTSVAGPDGRAVRWAGLLGPADLPCFVERLTDWNPKLLAGAVRMETPVLYFYSPRPVTISVGVTFPQGWVTEWYPKASSVKPTAYAISSQQVYRSDRTKPLGGGEIRWDAVDVLPGPDLEYPQGKGASPYYAARHTGSAPLRIGEQQEKLIFYRGIGDFEIPVRPVFRGSALEVSNSSAETIPLAIVFENRGGKIGYRKLPGLQDTVLVETPELTANLADLETELVEYLVEFGLYRAEAKAMLETWSDSWFEEGMRVIYILPRAAVDAVLPLEVVPAPASVARVFVGRVEVLSPWMRKQIEMAAAKSDVPALEKFGRFLMPFAGQIQRTTTLPRASIEEAAGRLVQRQLSGPGCVQ